jgi:alpha-beta hydrolase superfamily lysophospholipase
LTATSGFVTLRIMFRRSAAIGILAAMPLTASCSNPAGLADAQPSISAPPQPPTTTPAVPAGGSITPTGKPIQTVLPSPSASIGAACLSKAERRGILTFRAQAGAILTGAILGSGPSGVVIVHRSGSDLCSSLPYGRELATRGHQVLVFDLEGRGSSGYVRYDEAAAPLAFDVAAAAAALRSRGAGRVVVIGVGGGAVSTLAAATFAKPAFDGVVGISSADSHFGLDARAAVKQLPDLPLLLIASADDHTYDGETQNLYRLAASRNKRLMIVPGDRYGEIMFEHSVADPGNPYAVRDAVNAFAASYAGPPRR